MDHLLNKKVQIGQKLCKFNNQKLSYGLYVHKQSIYASAIGKIQQGYSNNYYISNNFPSHCCGLKLGDIVYGQVIKIKEQQVIITILQINKLSINMLLDGCLRRQHIRQKLTDSCVCYQSYHPNDIVKAKVISLGDSLKNFYLTTAEEDLGVLVAKNSLTHQLMLPYDWNTMVDINNQNKESRKVAKPQL